MNLSIRDKWGGVWWNMGKVFNSSDGHLWRMTRHCPVAAGSGYEFRAWKYGDADLFPIRWKQKANGNMENGRFFCLWQLFFRAVMSLPFSWSHKMSEVINGQQCGYGSFKDTGIMENFPFQSICHQWWLLNISSAQKSLPVQGKLTNLKYRIIVRLWRYSKHTLCLCLKPVLKLKNVSLEVWHLYAVDRSVKSLCVFLNARNVNIEVMIKMLDSALTHC